MLSLIGKFPWDPLVRSSGTPPLHYLSPYLIHQIQHSQTCVGPAWGHTIPNRSAARLDDLLGCCSTLPGCSLPLEFLSSRSSPLDHDPYETWELQGSPMAALSLLPAISGSFASSCHKAVSGESQDPHTQGPHFPLPSSVSIWPVSEKRAPAFQKTIPPNGPWKPSFTDLERWCGVCGEGAGERPQDSDSTHCNLPSFLRATSFLTCIGSCCQGLDNAWLPLSRFQ